MPQAGRLAIAMGDITTFDVDAIVNAANTSLAPGGGVCGAIHRAAGPGLAVACRAVGPCPTGEARITPGFRLRARWVLHAVGPVWTGGGNDEDRLLASCYRATMALAEEHGLASVAFPAISTGIYGFPPPRATAIALRELGAALAWAGHVRHVTCVCFDAGMLRLYEEARPAPGL